MVIKRFCHTGILFLMFLLISACSASPISPPITPSALSPHGPAALHIAQLWWVMLGFGTVIFLLVVALLFAAPLRRQRGTSDTPPDSSGGDTGRNWPILGGIVM